jgi:penicillin-insensitive murein endopeptidase
MWFSIGHTAVRAVPFAFASIVASLTLSSTSHPLHAPRATLPAAGALPKHATTARAALGPAALRFGRSIGSPTEGRLVGGLHLDEAPYLRVVPVYTSGDARWGLEPLVAMIHRAGRALRRRFPDAVLAVGHLSRAGGGDIDRHRSHESGRDADIAFFVRNASGKQLLGTRFVPFQADGTAAGWPGAYFDDAKNWSLVAAMVSDPEAHVTHLFVAAPLRARLLAYAERVGAPADLKVRAAEAMQQPRGTLPHDDHFHVRIGCPAHMSGCVENPVLYPSRPLPIAVARGGRAGPGQSWVTAAPKRRELHHPPTSSGDEPAHDEPEKPAPPASIPAPLDDVDG